MQFEKNAKVGTDYSTVRFAHFDFSPSVKASLLLSFNRIGGKKISDTLWEFPSFIISQVIEEVIHNTCYVCGGLMKDVEHPYSFEKIRECTCCGHSHTWYMNKVVGVYT